MRETRSQTEKRALTRKQLVDRIKSENEDSACSTTATTHNSTEDSSETKDLVGVFPLLDPPGEVLNMVIEHAVAAPIKDIIMLETAMTPALARVNRCLRKSVLPIYLAVNTFHLIAEKSEGGKGYQFIKFNIQDQVMDWLRPLGNMTPLFKHLIVHLGWQNDSQLVLQYSPEIKNLTVRHRATCPYCYKLDEPLPVFPRDLLASMTNGKSLRHFIEQVDNRNKHIAEEHLKSIVQLEAHIYNEATSIDRGAMAISMANIMGIERMFNESHMSFTIALYHVNMARLKMTPNIIKHNGVTYTLRRYARS
jgi:hypothetical protein